MKKKILSICIPLHNRTDKAIQLIENILKLEDDRYDIVISDSSDEGENLEKKWPHHDSRVVINRCDSPTLAIKNWKLALDHADGVFAMHVNDRDELLLQNLTGLLDFLEENQNLGGGVCKHISSSKIDTLIFKDTEEAILNVPFFSTHPTGIVINVEQYRKIRDLDDIFSDMKGIHPHDIVLGRISCYGKMFIYIDEVWKYASKEFYQQNKSGVEMDESKLFFYPTQRLYELKINIQEINSYPIDNDLKRKKIHQMNKTYLSLSTNTYFYFMESEHETSHYGIKKEKFNAIKRIMFSKQVLNLFSEEFNYSEKEKKEYALWLRRAICIPIIAKYTSFIRCNMIRNILRRIRINSEKKEHGLLR